MMTNKNVRKFNIQLLAAFFTFSNCLRQVGLQTLHQHEVIDAAVANKDTMAQFQKRCSDKAKEFYWKSLRNLQDEIQIKCTNF